MTEPVSTSSIAPPEMAGAASATNGTYAAQSAQAAHAPLPSSDTLIFDDGIPMETNRHRMQMELLLETLRRHWTGRHDYFCPNQVKTEDYRGPDLFVALNVDGTRYRDGWVVWEEGGKAPDVVIELLSASTANFDKTRKKEIYRTILRVPEYFWFDPFSGDLAGFALTGDDYVPLVPDERGRLVSRACGLTLAHWEGVYQDTFGVWLRWETLDGQLLPTNSEASEQEYQRAEQEHQRAEQERQRVAQAEAQLEQERVRVAALAAKLRELGIDPETLR